jgi:uncharacterized membrane protein YphA (DoxX/SURF4 family)
MFVTISLLLAAACLLPAAGKLTGQPKMRKSAAHFGIPWPRYRLIGVAELAAAAGILIGLWWHPLGLAAAATWSIAAGGAIALATGACFLVSLALTALRPRRPRAWAHADLRPGRSSRGRPPRSSDRDRPPWRPEAA